MAIRIKAKETIQTVGPYKDQYAFRLRAEKYNTLDLEKALEEAAKGGIRKETIRASLEAYASVMMDWLTEGHSVILPGFGTMRFAITASVAQNVEDVKNDLVKLRKIIFTPSPELKKQLNKTETIITCYDRYGHEILTPEDDA